MSAARHHRGKRAALEAWLNHHQPDQIGETEWNQILKELDPVSTSYLRRLLRESGIRLAPVVEGVRQRDFEELERTLTALAQEYEAAKRAGRQALRDRVIEAKEHARLAAREPGKRETKEEMTFWMRTWLENPPLFPEWVKLRRAKLKSTQSL